MKLPAFEIIGSKSGAVAIVEMRGKKNKKKIATEIMRLHKNVRTVLEKSSPRRGKYRMRKYKIIAGKKNTEVVHQENGCRILVNPRKTYFSPRESTERMRIAGMTKKNETVGVFFAGVGPFAIMIAKKAKPKRVVGIEINPAAAEYFRKNVKLNKVDDIAEVVQGDVKTEAKKYRGKFNRIVMPLPETAHKFLREAELCAKKRCTVHYYKFMKDDELDKEKELIRKSIKRKIKFTATQRVLPWGPRIWKMRIDFVIC